MKDMGERFGSSTWAVPVILSGDTVYVHTDIEQVKVDANGNEVLVKDKTAVQVKVQ